MKQALISSAAAILIAGGVTVGVGWYLSPPRLDPPCIVIDWNDREALIEAQSTTRSAVQRGEPIPEYCD
jgi:hypothetical protein